MDYKKLLEIEKKIDNGSTEEFDIIDEKSITLFYNCGGEIEYRLEFKKDNSYVSATSWYIPYGSKLKIGYKIGGFGMKTDNIENLFDENGNINEASLVLYIKKNKERDIETAREMNQMIRDDEIYEFID